MTNIEYAKKLKESYGGDGLVTWLTVDEYIAMVEKQEEIEKQLEVAQLESLSFGELLYVLDNDEKHINKSNVEFGSAAWFAGIPEDGEGLA